MEREKELVVKMKFDDYKMVSNYIKNELGLNRTVVNEMLRKLVRAVDIDSMITSKIEEYIGAREHNWLFKTKLESRMDELIDKEIEKVFDRAKKEQIEAIVRERISEKLEQL